MGTHKEASKIRQGQKKPLLEAKLSTEEQLCSCMPEGHSLKRKHGRGRKEAGKVAGYLKMNFDRDCDIKEIQKNKRAPKAH